MIGTVKNWVDQRGFGFIIGEDKNEYFVHCSDLKGDSLKPGDSVTFTPEMSERGEKAINVKVVEDEYSEHAKLD